MLANVLKVGLGIAVGAALSADTKKKVADAAGAILGDFRGLARKEAGNIKRFWAEELKPVLEGKPPTSGPTPPTSDTPTKPPEASA